MNLSHATRTLAGMALALIPAAALATPPGSPTFVGAFNIPAGGQITASGAVGNWTGTVDTSGGTAYIDTTLAPYSVSLFAQVLPVGPDSWSAPAGGRPGLQGVIGLVASADLHIAAPSAGTFLFNFAVTSGSDVEAYDNDGVYPLVGNSSLLLNLVQGEVFGFRVTSDSLVAASAGGAKPMGLPGLAAPGPQGVSISGLVFTPVPEASTVCAGIALLGMGVVAWNRSRRCS